MDLSYEPNIYLPRSTSEIRVRLALSNMFKPSSIFFYWPFQGGASFVDPLCYLCFMSVLLSCLLLAALVTCWDRAAHLALLYVMFSCVFVTFPYPCPGSGVVFDCIDSWSVPSSLLCSGQDIQLRMIRHNASIENGGAHKNYSKLFLNYVCCLKCLIWFFTSQSTIFQLCRDGSSWVEPVLSKD